MYKHLLKLALVAMLALPFVAQSQNVLTVCNGTDSNMYIPFFGLFADADQHIQMIYPADSIGAVDGYMIKKMTFYIDVDAPTEPFDADLGSWTVKLGETTATTLTSFNTGTTLTQVYAGAFDCSTDTLTLVLDQEYSYNGGNLLVDITHSGDGDYKTRFFVGSAVNDASHTEYTAFGEFFSQTYDFLPKLTLTYGEATSCFAVTDLGVDSVSAASVTLSWSDTANSGATYSVLDVGGDSVIATDVSATTYTVNGLAASTSYTFAVIADCSATDISDAATVTVMTDCGNGSCTITIYAKDGYGDGWGEMDPSYLVITQNGTTVASYSMAGQGVFDTPIYDTFQVSVCSDSPVTFSWVNNGDYYDEESSFTILDGGMNAVYSCNDASTLTTSTVFHTLNNPCPECGAPSLALDSATTSTITVHWSGDAESYDLYFDYDIVATGVTITGYTFGGLGEGTTHTVGVVARCSEGMFSSMVTLDATTQSTGNVEPGDTVLVVTYDVNDASMGYVTPNGTFTLQPYEMISVLATAYDGYELKGWDVTIEADGEVYNDHIDEPVGLIEEEVMPEMLGSHLTLTALFEPTEVERIDAARQTAVRAYIQGGDIVLSGAEGREVRLYDLSGRLLHRTLKAAERQRYAVPATGIYLLRIDGVGTRRVAIVR